MEVAVISAEEFTAVDDGDVSTAQYAKDFQESYITI
jgi:hypothetical protein